MGVTDCQRTKNGRKAFFRLKEKLCSKDGTAAHYNAVYKYIEGLVYNEDKKNWTFDRFILRHQESHNDLLRFKEYGHSMPDQSRLVEMCLNGIKAPTMQIAVVFV